MYKLKWWSWKNYYYIRPYDLKLMNELLEKSNISIAGNIAYIDLNIWKLNEENRWFNILNIQILKRKMTYWEQFKLDKAI